MSSQNQVRMKAIRVHAYGTSDHLSEEEIPLPLLGPKDVLVRVVAAGINPVDWKLRAGLLAEQIPKALPYTPGQDGSGWVVALGNEVESLCLGDEVCFYANFARGGTYAEFVAVDEGEVALKPATVSFATAAALPMPGQAAWRALVDCANLAAGSRILIHGGAGAVGSLAVQIAKARGAHVVTTASGEGLAIAASLGADEVIDYRKDRFERCVGNLDVVLDTLGGEIQQASWGVLRKGGLLLSLIQPPSPAQAEALGVNCAFVFTPSCGKTLVQLCAFVDQGARILVAEEFALADAARAHRLGESGGARGKMVLNVAPPEF